MMKNISSALSVASAVLLQACGSSSTTSGPVPVANTLAPELVASWKTDCITTQNSTTTNTVTQASGSGTVSISSGEAFRNTATFTQDGYVEFRTENYATANCNVNTLASTFSYSAVYYIGDSTIANDMSQATEIDFADSNSTTYSIFQIVNNTELYLGDSSASSVDADGSSDSTRLDGLGADELLKQ